jgi:hypothetical protein
MAGRKVLEFEQPPTERGGDDGTRVLSPADYSVEHIWPGNNLGRCDFPRREWDASYPDNWENATSVFFRAPKAERLFIASVDREGYGLVQTSTHEMQGRKFFYFGSTRGGQNWMDYLAKPGEGKYLEIQSGIAPTQNQRFELAPEGERGWTEAFAPLQIDPADVHDTNYGTAVSHAGAALEKIVSADELTRIDTFLREQARLPLDTRYSSGEPWGMRHEQLLDDILAAGLDFDVEAPGDAWDDLARGITIAAHNLRTVPNGVAVSRTWTDRIEASAAAQGTTWLHALLLATAALDQGNRETARDLAEQSIQLQPSWASYRLRALVTGDFDAASADYARAWATGDAPPELAVEIATRLMNAQRSAELKAFVDALPATIRDNERIILARAVVAANDRQFDELERLLFSRQFATIREGETLLTDLWARLRRGRLETQLDHAATPAELKQDLRQHPPPPALDLRMHVLEDVNAD